MDLQLLRTACEALGSFGAAVTTSGGAAQAGAPDAVVPASLAFGALPRAAPGLQGMLAAVVQGH
eukprot:6944143-Lingulodinium_polyedra.AAC.1